MSFLDTIRRAKAYLEEQGRVSLRALQREFELDDDALDELVEELVDVQQVAAREGKILAWIGAARPEALAPEPTTRIPEARSRPAAAARPAEGERRQLTVMFCDLVGSTGLSQRLDAEDLRNVVRAYQESASEVIERYAGHIAQYLGDGLLVYFGYPQAHEDDAERAVRAGREILTALASLNEMLEPQHGFRLAARVGIHTGPVVVGQMGGGAKSEALALGVTTNIAARLEGMAEPDSVVISGATLRLVPGIFATKHLGTPALKGIVDPIHAYAVFEATGVRRRLGVDPSKLTPLVGRDQEVGLLLERWERVGEGEGQTVLLSGEAGLGKSRLVQAFRERLAETPHGWLECRCSPYTQGSAFHPLVELMEQELGFQVGGDPDTKLARLEAGVAATDPSASDVVPLLAPLLSLPLPDRVPPLQFSPELQRKKTIEVLVAWIFSLAESQPLVVLVEDLHWCDASTVELLGWLVEQSPTAKVLTLASFRPDFEPPWPTRSHITALAVGSLSQRQARRLIGGMTGDVPLPDAVVEQVVERADGVPLFVEELTKMVLESDLVEERDGRYELTAPITQRDIPTTLQDSLMARLDRLDAGKPVAQIGAALGREFPYELVRRVSLEEEARLRAGLAQLVNAELLYQRGALPQADFTFKHALVQATAYQSLLASQRRALHGRVADALEQHFAERVVREPDVLARHCEAAGRTAQAIAHYQRAGERAKQASANEEGIGHLRRAIELLGTLPATRERDQQELQLQHFVAVLVRDARGPSHPELEGPLERARVLVSQIGDVPTLVLAGLAVSFYLKGELVTSSELAKQALEAAESGGGALDLLSAHRAVGIPLYWQGEFSRSLHHMEQAIGLDDLEEDSPFERRHALSLRNVCRAYASSCHVLLGYPDRGLAMSQEAVALARREEHPVTLAEAVLIAAPPHFLRREPRLTEKLADEVIALVEEFGFAHFLAMARITRGWARTVALGGGEAVAEIQRGIAELERTGVPVTAPSFLAMLAEALWNVGRHEDALDALGLGVARAQQTGSHQSEAELHRLRAEILLDQNGGEPEEAENLLHRALEIAREQEAKWFELRAATSLARLLRDQGRRDEARALLAPTYDWFTEGFDTAHLKDAKALLDELA